MGNGLARPSPKLLYKATKVEAMDALGAADRHEVTHTVGMTSLCLVRRGRVY